MIRVLLADDEALIRSGLAVLLRHEPGFEVVGELPVTRMSLMPTRRLAR